MNKAPDENKQTKSGKVRELGFWSICHWPPMCSASSNVLLEGSLASAQDCGGYLYPSIELSRVHLAILYPSRSPSGCYFLYIWPFLDCSLVLWNLGVLCCQSNAFSGFILSAFKTGFSSYSATSCYKQRGAPSLDGAPSQHPCPLLPLLGSFMNCRRLHGQFINDCKTSILKIWRKFLMKSTAAVGDGFFFEFQSLTNFEFPSITSTVKDGWGGQNPCPRSLNLKVWEDLWHSKSSISMLWLGWSSFSTSARCTSTTDEIENQRGAKSLPSA